MVAGADQVPAGADAAGRTAVWVMQQDARAPTRFQHFPAGSSGFQRVPAGSSGLRHLRICPTMLRAVPWGAFGSGFRPGSTGFRRRHSHCRSVTTKRAGSGAGSSRRRHIRGTFGSGRRPGASGCRPGASGWAGNQHTARAHYLQAVDGDVLEVIHPSVWDGGDLVGMVGMGLARVSRKPANGVGSLPASGRWGRVRGKSPIRLGWGEMVGMVGMGLTHAIRITRDQSPAFVRFVP